MHTEVIDVLIKEASEKWNISKRRIRQLIQDGRIEGVFKVGSTWSIPDDVSKPIDKRYREEKNLLLIYRGKQRIVDWTYNSNAIGEIL